MSDFSALWAFYRTRTEQALSLRLPAISTTSPSPNSRLHHALRYACLSGGKRLRAMLVYACGQLVGAELAQLDAPAAAIEMMHAYSLVHDDLPAMDDDQQRRGQPTCHIAYDEATAILVGDALQSLAFETLCTDRSLRLSAARRVRMIQTLAQAVGAAGMVGGQALDIEAAGQTPTVAELRLIRHLKTGQLIRAAARLGGLCAVRVNAQRLNKLDEYASKIGLAFQIVDDMLDASPAKRCEAELDSSLAATEARNLCEQASQIAATLGNNAQFLQQLAHFVVNRSF